MRNQLVKSLVALFLSTASLEASAGLVSFTSTEFQQTESGQTFTFTINDAPLADLIDGTFLIHARGDYTINSQPPEVISVKIEDGNYFDQDVGATNANSTVTNPDLVEWSESFLLPGDELFSWTQDHKIIITLALSPDVTFDLNAIQGGNPFVQATISYTTSAVPLPAATWLFLSGLIGMLGYGKQRKTS
ncbi:VPLPA-CTERM sorting domain-containing protein [Methylomonas methanica]|uniref:Secreted protein n=1 Tax=Methylomonas methanica TaxID=421 RepID=A0A177MB67_METMH|nr:VPLPA-CTERM sorting domain-containing protein [Methylomonas methanica]OAI02784.1 hypothetical protein A1332_02495 [Methylomonas methanica]